LSYDIRNTLETHDARREDLDEIIKAGNRALTLTKQLLAFGRRQVSSSMILDLNCIIVDMTKMLKRLISEDINLTTDLGSPLYTVRMDQSHVEQMILNLVLNSRDAMPKNGTITISTVNVEMPKIMLSRDGELSPGPYVLLQVSDTGCGMDQQTLAHIYEPYYTTKENNQGTGLGLSTVYGIIKQYAGHIVVESAPGKGTTFKIFLPYAEGVAQNLPHEPVEATTHRGHETILIVEDEDIVRRVTKRALSNNGYTVFASRDAKEALEFIDQYGNTIDLLLTDVVMPGMNGRQLAEVVAQKRPGIAVLYMSAYSEDVAMRRGNMGPQTAFIEKAFLAQNLTQKVREVIDTHRTSVAS